MPVTKVRSKWVSGNLVFTDGSDNTIAVFDAANQLMHRAIGSIFCQRFRSAVAAVNAGATLLAALGTGYKYRLIDAFAIAIGGAVGSVTTVDLLGTQSASGVKLVAFAQASLTQSTLLRAGASGAAILANGASFIACDANTAITIGITGSSISTATSIDVVLTYAIDLV